jgi:type VI secretion system protein ImpB
MDDFSPAALARNIEPLRRLLEARNDLANLLRYMDGKVGAEELVAKVLGNPELMRSLHGDNGEASGAIAQTGAENGDASASASPDAVDGNE